MIADALQIFVDQQQVRGVFAVFRILTDDLNEVRFYLDKVVVHNVVMDNDGVGLVNIFVYITIHSIHQHDHGLRRHLLDILPRKPAGHVGNGNGQLGDIRGVVADALHVRHHFHGGGDGPQVPGHRLLLDQELEAEIFDLLLFLVHQVVFLHDPLGGLHIVIQQSLDRVLDGLLDHAAHVGHFFAQLLQLFVKFQSHQPNRPVI